MTLRQKQSRFMQLLGILVNYIYASGYEITGGDLKAHGGHMNGSLHYIGLAIDLNLFKDGKYLKKTEDHEKFGLFWEGLDPNCRWGGRFQDGNHYSYTHGGKA